jgi:hypothetical protein
MENDLISEASVIGQARPLAGAHSISIDRRSLFRLFLEVGLFFILSEGLVRRIVPKLSVSILGFKFVYFPVLYFFFIIAGLGKYVRLRLPIEMKLFLFWACLVTLWNAASHPATSALGALVNLMFIPVAYISASLYQDTASLRPFFWRLTVISGLLGILGIYQSYLPPSHWLNLAVDGSFGFDQRISSTFQFCTVFGNFAVGGEIACLASFCLAENSRKKYISVACMVLLYVGSFFSGSRIGALGTLCIIGCVFVFSTKRMRRIAATVAVVTAIVGSAYFLTRDTAESDATVLLSSRSLSVEGIGARVRQDYFGDLLQIALETSNFVGTGWGPFTIGVNPYIVRMQIDESPPVAPIEGGFVLVLAQTGVLGVILFIAMHRPFFLAPKVGPLGWLNLAVGSWSLLGNVPLCLQETSVLAIYWWVLVGLAWSISHAVRNDGRKVD